MASGELIAASTALAGLYLRGGPDRPRLQRHRWGRVRDTIALYQPNFSELCSVLRSAGLWDEASCLELPGVIDWAGELIQSRQAVTVACPSYPARWLDVLGSSAPVALWCHNLPSAGNYVAVTGIRQADKSQLKQAMSVGRSIVRAGFHCVTGGAAGCDSGAIQGVMEAGGAGRGLIILPQGINTVSIDPSLCYLSCCPPFARFSRGQAMERNVLTYALADLAIVVKSHYKSGGTWAGAKECLRRQLTQVAVMNTSPAGGDPAATTLCNLGAISINSLSHVDTVLQNLQQAIQNGHPITGDDYRLIPRSVSVVREELRQWQPPEHRRHHPALACP